MEKLKTQFTSSGYDFEQLERNGNWALYEKRRGGSTSFELIKIRSRESKSSILDGREIILKSGEFYPRTTDWGNFGWSFMEYLPAVQEFRKISGKK